MNLSATCTVIIFFVLGIASGVAAIECYVCSSLTISNCGDPFRSSGIDKGSGQMCDVFSVTIKTGSGTSVTAVTRNVTSSTSTGCTDLNTPDITSRLCKCNTNLCNDYNVYGGDGGDGGGAVTTRYSTAMVAGLVSASLVLFGRL
jgi:hypothetical protein